MKWGIAIGLLVVALVGYLFWPNDESQNEPPPPAPVVQADPRMDIIGRSVEGRAIESYTFGRGATRLLLVGGVHGGYEWNSVALAYRVIDELKANPALLPAALTATVIPVLNPDGLYRVIGQEGRFSVAAVPADEAQTIPGRFNAHQVDLNRNFDCKWQAEGQWRGQVVSGGTAPFSEPEAQALRDFVLAAKPAGVVLWHSQANAVYGSECEHGVLPETLKIMNSYATAAGYPAIASFTAYPVAGDVEGWLAAIGIPAITVELKTHQTIEWEQNWAGVKALFEYYRLRDVSPARLPLS